MPSPGSRPDGHRARVRLRLAVLVLFSAGLVAAVGSGAAAEVAGPLFQIDPPLPTTTTEAPTTTAEPSTSSTVEPTTTEFLDTSTTEAPTTTAVRQTTTTRRRSTTTAQDLQTTTSTEPEVTTTTTNALLVPGDGTDGAESTTTTSTTVVTVSDSTSSGLSEGTMLWLIVAGLVAIALLIALWTIRFWRATRPERPPVEEPPPDPTTVFPAS